MEDMKILVCQKCGKEFQVGKKSSDPNQFLTRKYCPDCSSSRLTTIRKCKDCGKEFEVERTPDGRHFRNVWKCEECRKPATTKTLVCQKCGKEFQVGKYPGTNSFIKRKLCDDCLNYKETERTVKCKKCGKKFTVYRYGDGLHFQKRDYCDECLKPEIKQVQCDVCGKWFTVKRVQNPQHGFSVTKYCSDECATVGWKRATKQTCQNRYGVDYPCLTENALSANAGNVVSETNKRFAKLLQENGILYDKTETGNIKEFVLEDKNSHYSYDLHLTDTKILIELNPTYTHRTQDNHFGKGKDINYHRDKTAFAKERGYRCINVWDWDDWNKIIQLVQLKQKLYARQLKIKSIDYKDANIFINYNHIQGSCSGNTKNYGLFLNDELVQVMTFGKPRYNKNYEWELLRLCTHSCYKIVGGAERLFKSFLKEEQPNSIISYCDSAKFNGDVYNRLGFSLLRQSAPSKIWSKDKQYITDNLLRQLGYDRLFGTNYGKGTSNEELMLNSGWFTVYDCGQDTYVWEKV